MPMHDWSRVLGGTFASFHHLWVAELVKSLNSGVLPADYYAYAEQVAGDFGPDVLTLQEKPPPGLGWQQPDAPAGALALAEAPPQVDLTLDIEVAEYARRRRGVVIRHTSGDRVVALVEVVSPGNKASRNEVRKFVEKVCAALTRHRVHVLVLDLLPPTTSAPEGMHGAIMDELGLGGQGPPSDRPLVFASYVGSQPVRAFVCQLAVGMGLPAMPLFLTAEHYVNVPLAASYLAAFSGMPRADRAALGGA